MSVDTVVDYEWVVIDGIRVGRPQRRRSPDAPLTAADVAQMIACPTCRAKVCESCQTKGGNHTVHAARLIPQRCPCGALLEVGHRYCPPCAEIARTRTYYRREGRVPTHLRRKKSA